MADDEKRYGLGQFLSEEQAERVRSGQPAFGPYEPIIPDSEMDSEAGTKYIRERYGSVRYFNGTEFAYFNGTEFVDQATDLVEARDTRPRGGEIKPHAGGPDNVLAYLSPGGSTDPSQHNSVVLSPGSNGVLIALDGPYPAEGWAMYTADEARELAHQLHQAADDVEAIQRGTPYERKPQ